VPSRIVRSLRWTPLLFIGAIALGFLLSDIRGPTIYGEMRIVRLGFILAAAVAIVAAMLAILHWQQLPMFSRICALAPFVLVLAFACYVGLHGVA
jgi:hypothetical protein